MAEEKLPKGFFKSSGDTMEVIDEETKEILRTVTHPKGVIVGPHEPANPKPVKFVCPYCNDTRKTDGESAVCGGGNIQVIPGPAKVVDGKIIFTQEIFGAEKGDVFRDDIYDTFGQAQWRHGGKPVVEGMEFPQGAVIESKDVHPKTMMEVAS